MARDRSTMLKRQKEQRRQEKQQEKAKRRSERKQEGSSTVEAQALGSEDQDLMNPGVLSPLAEPKLEMSAATELSFSDAVSN